LHKKKEREREAVAFSQADQWLCWHTCQGFPGSYVQLKAVLWISIELCVHLCVGSNLVG
jgi:hypothetical protein